MCHDQVSSFHVLVCCQQEHDTQIVEVQDAVTTGTVHPVEQDAKQGKSESVFACLKTTQFGFC